MHHMSVAAVGDATIATTGQNVHQIRGSKPIRYLASPRTASETRRCGRTRTMTAMSPSRSATNDSGNLAIPVLPYELVPTVYVVFLCIK
jgi:hypothetical protein